MNYQKLKTKKKRKQLKNYKYVVKNIILFKEVDGSIDFLLTLFVNKKVNNLERYRTHLERKYSKLMKVNVKVMFIYTTYDLHESNIDSNTTTSV